MARKFAKHDRAMADYLLDCYRAHMEALQEVGVARVTKPGKNKTRVARAEAHCRKTAKAMWAAIYNQKPGDSELHRLLWKAAPQEEKPEAARTGSGGGAYGIATLATAAILGGLGTLILAMIVAACSLLA